MPSSYTVGDHYESFVRELVSSGRYSSASEVLRDGLRLLEEREQLREIKLKALREKLAPIDAAFPAISIQCVKIVNASHNQFSRGEKHSIVGGHSPQ